MAFVSREGHGVSARGRERIRARGRPAGTAALLAPLGGCSPCCGVLASAEHARRRAGCVPINLSIIFDIILCVMKYSHAPLITRIPRDVSLGDFIVV